MADETGIKKAKDPEFLSTLERGLQVLSVFGSDRPEMSLSEVAAAASLSPAVARRCLNTLTELGYVGRNGRRFLLLPKMLEFANAFLSSTNIEQAITPALQVVRDETGNSVSMGVRVENQVICIAHVSAAQAIRPSGNIGTSFPLHATSLGKVILAFLSPDDLANYFANSQREALTPSTVTADLVLKGELSNIRKVGFATSMGEFDSGVWAVAVPVLDNDRSIVGAINCSTATSREDRESFESARVPLLREAASHVERELRRFPTLLHALRR